MQPELTGYTDRWSVAPGQTIRFMVSTDADTYDVVIFRLIHADSNPEGPGVKQQVLDALVNRRPHRVAELSLPDDVDDRTSAHAARDLHVALATRVMEDSAELLDGGRDDRVEHEARVDRHERA